jgi:hypothetical protein
VLDRLKDEQLAETAKTRKRDQRLKGGRVGQEELDRFEESRSRKDDGGAGDTRPKMRCEGDGEMMQDLGGLGQLFIFETIQHFGSLTLVMVTVTRKLFTMLLSVIVFEHVLNKSCANGHPPYLGSRLARFITSIRLIPASTAMPRNTTATPIHWPLFNHMIEDCIRLPMHDLLPYWCVLGVSMARRNRCFRVIPLWLQSVQRNCGK